MRKGFISLIFMICFIEAVAPLHVKAQPYYSDAVAVLMYHHIHSQDRSSSTIHPKLFHDQLQSLLAHGFHFISMQQYRQFLKGEPVPSNAVLVTFDDGYESYLTHAYPILKKLHIPSVNFCITKHLSGTYKTYVAPLRLTHLQQLSANHIPEAEVEFQCHSNNMHHYVGNTPMLVHSGNENPLQLIQDLTFCIRALQPFNQHPVDSFSYPYGKYNQAAQQAVSRAGIQYAFTIQEGISTRQSSHLTLPRINAGSPNITSVHLVQKLKKLAIAHQKKPA